MTKIIDLQAIPAELLSQVGGKARGLNGLIRFGYAVPEGFIVTDIDENDSFEAAAAKYESSGFGEVSVRSSASLEDGNDYSAAGQFSTFLNVSGTEAFKQAVRDCVASLHSVTAEHYARTFLQSAECRMTVVVQKMVDARCAGVIFTKAPMRPGAILVEAVPGLGENLVSGKMAAQQYLVIDGRVETMPENPVLTESEAVYIAEGGKKTEELFGQPMDLEWAVDRDGKVQWLQARPITIEESVTVNELDSVVDGEHCVNTTGNIGEVMPGAVTPLNLSTNMYALDYGVKATLVEMRCMPESTPPYTYISSYYNHMFFNMTNMYRTCHQTFGTAKHTLDIILCGHELTEYPDVDMKEDPVWKKILHTIPYMKLVFSGEAARRGMDRTIARLKFDLTRDMHDIYRQILENFELFKKVHYYHYCTSYYSGGATNMLTLFLEKDFEDRNQLQAILAGCLTQIEDFESANVLRMMRSLSQLILEDAPDAAGYSVEQLADYMVNRASDVVKEAYRTFMSKHGHRGIREMEIRSLSWNQNRKSFFTSLKSVLASSGSDNAVLAKPWTEYADELLYKCQGGKKQRMMKYVEKARKGVCYREYTKSKVIFALDLFKQAYRRLSELMTDAGLLPDVDAVYFLTQEEVGRLLEGEMSLVKKALARRRIFPQQESMKFPFVTLGIPRPVSARETDSSATSFQGTPVSRGTVSGKARVVRNEEDAASLENGEIMVAACTDIGWTPYYNIIGGLVTEIGSALSHGIVVAREYALPSIVNVPDVMDEIHTGDMLTIDGNTGMVFIDERCALV